MSPQEKPDTAFALSLAGGILMLIVGGMSTLWFTPGGWGGGMMRMMGASFGFMAGFSLIGVVSGIVVVIGALMLNARPSEHTAWGTVILLFSVVSLLGMGGFLIGAVLGIVGGSLALSWRPRISS